MGRPAVPDSEFVSTGQAARLLAVSSRTVLAWCDAGRIPGVRRTLGGGRRGGDYRIPRSAIDAMLRPRADFEAWSNRKEQR